jgi:hypothetical protein
MTTENGTSGAVLLKPGARLRSQACSSEVIVVRAGAATVDLRCGGYAMIGFEDPAASPHELVPGFDGGNQLGKRYVSAVAAGFEVLVTKAGVGTLADGDVPLAVKDAKPLPSSD